MIRPMERRLFLVPDFPSMRVGLRRFVGHDCQSVNDTGTQRADLSELGADGHARTEGFDVFDVIDDEVIDLDREVSP